MPEVIIPAQMDADIKPAFDRGLRVEALLCQLIREVRKLHPVAVPGTPPVAVTESPKT